MRHNLPTSETFPKRCTGPIWMKKHVAQLNYYNLNRWQIRNEAAHATESEEEYRKTREMHHSTITALYQSNSTDPDPHALYRQPLEDILNMSNERLVNWLQSHSASSSYRAHYHHDRPSHLTQQVLHKFIQHETERCNQVLLLTIKSGPGYRINILFSKEPLNSLTAKTYFYLYHQILKICIMHRGSTTAILFSFIDQRVVLACCWFDRRVMSWTRINH